MTDTHESHAHARPIARPALSILSLPDDALFHIFQYLLLGTHIFESRNSVRALRDSFQLARFNFRLYNLWLRALRVIDLDPALLLPWHTLVKKRSSRQKLPPLPSLAPDVARVPCPRSRCQGFMHVVTDVQLKSLHSFVSAISLERTTCAHFLHPLLPTLSDSCPRLLRLALRDDQKYEPALTCVLAKLPLLRSITVVSPTLLTIEALPQLSSLQCISLRNVLELHRGAIWDVFGQLSDRVGFLSVMFQLDFTTFGTTVNYSVFPPIDCVDDDDDSSIEDGESCDRSSLEQAELLRQLFQHCIRNPSTVTLHLTTREQKVRSEGWHKQVETSKWRTCSLCTDTALPQPGSDDFADEAWVTGSSHVSSAADDVVGAYVGAVPSQCALLCTVGGVTFDVSVGKGEDEVADVRKKGAEAKAVCVDLSCTREGGDRIVRRMRGCANGDMFDVRVGEVVSEEGRRSLAAVLETEEEEGDREMAKVGTLVSVGKEYVGMENAVKLVGKLGVRRFSTGVCSLAGMLDRGGVEKLLQELRGVAELHVTVGPEDVRAVGRVIMGKRKRAGVEEVGRIGVLRVIGGVVMGMQNAEKVDVHDSLGGAVRLGQLSSGTCGWETRQMADVVAKEVVALKRRCEGVQVASVEQLIAGVRELEVGDGPQAMARTNAFAGFKKKKTVATRSRIRLRPHEKGDSGCDSVS